MAFSLGKIVAAAATAADPPLAAAMRLKTSFTLYSEPSFMRNEQLLTIFLQN
jgi:hypothetical protein